MNRCSVSYKSMICCAFLITLGITSCDRAIKPERLKLVDGEIDACLLATPTELETVMGFNVVADNHPLNPVGTSCMYYSKTDGHPVPILRILVTTDATLRRNHSYDTAEYLYNSGKAEELKDPHQYTVEDIDGLGNRAYFSNDQNFELAVRVLNNGIYYDFTGYSTIGINRDKLIQIAIIALQRAP